jgi:hypothetical protein
MNVATLRLRISTSWRMRFPFEGLRPYSVPARCHHRVGCLSCGWLRYRVLYAARYGNHRVLPVPGWCHHFWRNLRVFPEPPSPGTFVSGSSSRTLDLHFRVQRAEPARHLTEPSTFLGVFRPHRDISRRNLSVDIPGPPCRPRRFARPRRFVPPPTLQVYFTLLPRPGFALQGFSLVHSRTSSSLAVALLSFPPSPCPRLLTSARTGWSPPGLCSMPESVTDRSCLGHDPPDPLLSFTSLGFFSTHLEDDFPPSPLAAFPGPQRIGGV